MKDLPETPAKIRLSIDEHIMPFRRQMPAKQYVKNTIKNKPNSFGCKIFFLCGESGMPYNLLVYQGKTNELLQEYSDLGIGVLLS